MSKRTATGKGLERPHKAVAAVPGQGSAWRNAKSINTEKSPKGQGSKGGLPHTYFGNSKACNTE